VSRGFRCSIICLAVFPVLVISHMPFPSGGNRCGGQALTLRVCGAIVVPNTLWAGSRASLSHMLILTLGYLYTLSLRDGIHVMEPSATSRLAVCNSSAVNRGLRFLLVI